MADKARLLVICGPTATGKTSLSVALAQALDGEVVCADSMQIYRRLDIGTAKVTKEEMCGVPHHLVDFLAPEKQFSVAEYVARASACIADIAARGKTPLLVGGTGLYIQSLLYGVRFTEHKSDPALRARLQARLEQEGIEPLYAQLAQVDPETAAAVDMRNYPRVLRALEIYLQTGETMAQHRAKSLPPERPYNAVVLGLHFAQRSALYARIDARVDAMLAQGLLREACEVYDNRADYVTAAQAIGYKEFFPYFEGTQDLAACADALKRASRRYAKRQLTWFTHMDGVRWLEADASELPDQALEIWRSEE